MGNKSFTIRKRFEMKTVSMTGASTVVDTIQTYPHSRIGGNTPNFKALAAKGLYCTNDLVASKRYASFSPSKITLINTFENAYYLKPIYTEVHHPFPGVAVGISGQALVSATNDAAMRIRMKIQKEASTFSGPTFLGELRETAQMIKKPAEALADYLNKAVANAARKKRRKKGSKRKRDLAKDNSTADAVGNTWLELQMGILPFISDIGAIAEASLRRYEEQRITRVFGVGVGETSLSSVERPTSGPNYVRYNRNIERTDYVHVKFLAGLRTSVSRSNTGLERVIEQSRMNWSEIIPAAWELLPWSFLIDYFGNIGDVLNAASVSLANVAWSQQTTRSIFETTDIGVSCDEYSSNQYMQSYELGRSHSISSSVHRRAASIPIPDLRFELPGRKTQLLNIAALLNGVFL